MFAEQTYEELRDRIEDYGNRHDAEKAFEDGDLAFEVAESVVPIWHTERVELWGELGYPDPDDNYGSNNILELIGIALDEAAREIVYRDFESVLDEVFPEEEDDDKEDA